MKIYGNGIDFPQNRVLKELGVEETGVHTIEQDTVSRYLVSAGGESVAAAFCNAFADVLSVLKQDGIEIESFPIRTPETLLFQRPDPSSAAELRMQSEGMIAGFAIRSYDELNVEQQPNGVIGNSSVKSIYEIYKGQHYLICETRLDEIEKSNATGLTTGSIEKKITVYRNETFDGGSINLLLPSSCQHCDYRVVEYGYWPEQHWFSTVHRFTCKK